MERYKSSEVKLNWDRGELYEWMVIDRVKILEMPTTSDESLGSPVSIPNNQRFTISS